MNKYKQIGTELLSEPNFQFNDLSFQIIANQ